MEEFFASGGELLVAVILIMMLYVVRDIRARRRDFRNDRHV
jgi:hypothetical protein